MLLFMLYFGSNNCRLAELKRILGNTLFEGVIIPSNYLVKYFVIAVVLT